MKRIRVPIFWVKVILPAAITFETSKSPKEEKGMLSD